MTGPFRFVPPEPRPDALARPRLLRPLVGRWRHRVTTVVGGAGLGKTTLLAQAVVENRLVAQGEDVWVGVQPQDSEADRLATVVATAVAGEHRGRSSAPDLRPMGGHDEPAPSPTAVADAIWRRTPTEVCLLFDDVHWLTAGSPGATWLAQLIAGLPANGHVVLSSRSEPPLDLGAVEQLGGLLRLGEDDLRFSDDEVFGFAAQRGLDPARLSGVGGWPAMVELVASASAPGAGGPTPWESYLWEEVLEPLGAERRHVLAVLCDLGGADDELVSAALGRQVELTRALRYVPLVARDDGGWYSPHGLWRDAPGIALAPHVRQEVRRRAVAHHLGRSSFDEAFRLLREAELWDLAPDVLRGACLAYDRLIRGQLGRWLAVCPDDVKASLAGCLAHALDMVFTEPVKAYEPLERAVARCRDKGDVDAELIAIAQLGRLAAWRQDLVAMAQVGKRLAELEGTGRPRARGLATYARVIAADVEGDDEALRRELDSVRPGAGRAGADGESPSAAVSVDPVQEVLMAYVWVMLHLDLGEPDVATAEIERLRPTAAASVRYVLDLLELRIWWTEGRLTDVSRRFPQVLVAAKATGEPYHVYLGHSYGSQACSQAGDVAVARRLLEESLDAAPPPRAGELSVHSAVATASLRLAEGDETAAAAVLRQALKDHGLDRGFERRGWRHALPLSYLLLPETRAHWDALPLRGYMATSRDLAAAVVVARSGRGSALLRQVEVPDAAVVQALLHYRFAAELALGLSLAGRPEGRRLLDELGAPGRVGLRDVADTRPRQVKAARALLAAVPAPPSRPSYLAVLGPLVLRRDGPDGEEVVDSRLRRQRVHALVAFLLAQRRTTRQAVTAALWPDLDERAASNNLAVTLNALLQVLEPWRDAREPSYLVRVEGQAVALLTGEHLRVDVDDFGDHLAAADRAEADEQPSEALEHLLAAVALYRDELHVELPEADWFALDREHYRSRFVGAATRAGQLLVAHSDVDVAKALARRAIAVDPWCEDAYGVLVKAALAQDDRSAARRALMRCLAALHDLGAQPSPSTQQLHRRIQGMQA